MNIVKGLKPISALVLLASLVGCIDPQVGVRRTGSDGDNRVARGAGNGSNAAVHIVQKGETLYAISFKYAVDFRDIARWNRIADPYTIYPNQQLLVRDPTSAPRLEASAVRPNSPTTTSTNAGNGVVVTTIPEQRNASSQSISGPPINAGTAVGAGDGVSVAAIATQAPLANAQPLDAGMPSGFTDSAPAAPSSTTALNRPSGLPSSAPAIIPEAEIPAPDSATETQTAPGVKPTAGRNGWGWPVQGKLIATFASTDPGRQGIDIAGNFGDAVYAANAGDVVYSGRGIIGYGELIVIKHDDATLTAYGHNRRRLVKEGQRIKQGETIAEMGRDPQGRALLHFELRRNGKPVDPLGVLPARPR